MGLLDSKLTPVERVKVINAVRGKLPIDYSTEMTIIPVEFEEQSSRIPVIIPEREKIESFFEDFYNRRGSCVISYKTTAEWDARPDLVGQKSNIYVYLDADSKVDPVTGETIYIPMIKLGDGVTPLIDTPFISAETSSVVMEHLGDTYIHIQPGEREALQQTLDEKLDKSTVDDLIEIDAPSGVFDNETFQELMSSRLKAIIYEGQIYKFSVKQGRTYRYFTDTADPNERQYIEVNLDTKQWVHQTAINQVLDDHIQDQIRHITAAERARWNNKLNCEDTVSEERLILNRN